MDTYICMVESLHCSSEAITLLIGYTPIQNVFGVKKNKNKIKKKRIGLPMKKIQETWVQSLGRAPAGGNGYPLQYSCLENPMDGGAWRATVHGVAKSCA